MTSQIFGAIRDGAPQQRGNGELILCLMNAMPDRTIFAFSRTCRLAYELAKPQMKRRKLRFLYINVILHNSHPCRLFELLEEQPEALLYIKTLRCQTDFLVRDRRIGGWRENYRRVQQGQHDNIPPFIRQFCALPYIRGLSDSERRDLETGDDIWKDTVILASSMLCPNLEYLHIDSNFTRMAKAITPITRYIQNIEDDQSAHNQSDAIAGGLAKPQWLTLLGAFSSTRIADIVHILSLPSLRRAIVGDVRLWQLSDRPMINELSTTEPISNIERLTLSRCDIDPAILGALIEHMPNLEWLRHQDHLQYINYVAPSDLPTTGLDTSDSDSSPSDMALRLLADTDFPQSEGLDAYAKHLIFDMFSRPKLMSRGLKVGAISNRSLEWSHASIIVKKPHISRRDIGYGTVDHPRYF